MNKYTAYFFSFVFGKSHLLHLNQRSYFSFSTQQCNMHHEQYHEFNMIKNSEANKCRKEHFFTQREKWKNLKVKFKVKR